MRAGPELKFKNYESVQHGLQFSRIKKEAKISFHRHFNINKLKKKRKINKETLQFALKTRELS